MPTKRNAPRSTRPQGAEGGQVTKECSFNGIDNPPEITVEVCRVVKVSFRRGKGIAADPHRICTAFYYDQPDGGLIFVLDSWADQEAAARRGEAGA